MPSLKRAFAIGLAAIALGFAFAPSLESAAADSGETFTTQLQPGFNLAGWIEPETGVDALFEAIPQLEAVYTWDAEAQRYRVASVGQSAQPEGDLTTLLPGMGLWLEIAGTAPVPWTRQASPDPSAGLVSLREGWNLVAWTGNDGATLDDAFASLEGDLEVVLTWDARAGRFDVYAPGSPTTGAAPRIRQGDAVFVGVSSERYWLQPGSVDPTVEFYGEFTEERKAEIRAENLSVVTYFAERYGLLETDYALYVGADRDSLEQAQRQALGIPDPSYVLCGAAVNEQVFIADWCATATHDLTSPLAHEYFHVLQTHLVSRVPVPETSYVADWLLEGTADFMAIEYHISRGHRTRQEVDQVLTESVVYSAPDLVQLEGNISAINLIGYNVATFAVQRVVEQSSETAILEFFRELPARTGWEDAFGASFGMDISNFYSSFAALVERMIPVTRAVTVTTSPPDGSMLLEWNGYPLRVRASGQSVSLGATMTEHGAELQLPEGEYSVNVSAVCRVFGGEFYASAYQDGIGYFARDGVPRVGGGPQDLKVAGEDIAITINLAGLPSEVRLNCYDGPRFNIVGRVTNASGVPLVGYDVLAHATNHKYDRNRLDLNYTDEAGTFSIDAPDGYAYTLTVIDTCHAWLGAYHEDEGLLEFDTQDYYDRPTPIPVDGADISGIEIVIPAALDTGGC